VPGRQTVLAGNSIFFQIALPIDVDEPRKSDRPCPLVKQYAK
jgi:hypothetical protein